jgi:hypothetical protein
LQWLFFIRVICGSACASSGLDLVAPFFTNIALVELVIILVTLAFLCRTFVELALFAAAHMPFTVLAGNGLDAHIAVLSGFSTFVPFFFVHDLSFVMKAQNCCRKKGPLFAPVSLWTQY